ncbi:MAG: PhoH family protein [Cyclobacteriaceae bacterium]
MTRSKKSVTNAKKIFVLDTSVILYSHDAIMNFEEHDVGIPITVLEELDQFKKGSDTRNFEAREFIRMLDALSAEHTLTDWIPLNGKSKGSFKVVLSNESEVDAELIFDERKADHKILNAALTLREAYPDRNIILVTKDINLRLKAKSLNLVAQDYETGKVKHVDDLDRGTTVLERVNSQKISDMYRDGFCEVEDIRGLKNVKSNQYYILKSSKNSALSYYNPETQKMEKVDKRTAYGIRPKNAEQTFALHAIMNPNVRLVTVQGVAGTGKTLLALAGALEQRRDFKQVYLARPIVPLSNKDIGYLPGDIKSKLNPYMEPLWDNLKFIQNQFSESDKDFTRITEMVNNEKLVITPLAYIRGRSLSNIFFIVDEAQNLTPHEVKTIITRAGENCKIVFTGDIYQIDTPYLDSQSNGLSYLIDRVAQHPLYAHVTLVRGERSELANLANELL